MSWAPIAGTPIEPTGSCPNLGMTTAPLADQLDSVHFADAATVYITGENGDVLKSTSAGADFTEMNKTGGSCQANPGSGQALTDSAWTRRPQRLLGHRPARPRPEQPEPDVGDQPRRAERLVSPADE